MQEGAFTAIKSVAGGVMPADVQELASLGAFGRNRKIESQIINKYCNRRLTPEPFHWQVPIKVKDATGMHIKMTDVAMCLPFDWFESIAEEQVAEVVFGKSGLGKFWTDISPDDPRLHEFPAEGRRFIVPLLIHGDGAVFAEKDSLMVISMRSVLSEHSVGDSQLLLAAIPKSCRVQSGDPTQDTWLCVWRILVWAFLALFIGKHPDRDPDNNPWPPNSKRAEMAGKPFRSRLRGWIFSLSGDYDYFSNDLKLPHFSSISPCHKCGCAWDGANPYDFRPGAAWKASVKTSEWFRQHPITDHPIMGAPHVRAETFQIDVLHMLELGVSQYAVASLFFELCFNELIGSKAAKLEVLYEKIRQIYFQLAIPSDYQISRLRYKDFSSEAAPHKNYPQLHSSQIKGRVTRYLIPVSVELARQHRRGNHGGHRFLLFEALEGMCSLIDQGPMFLDPAQQLQFRKCTEEFLLHAGWLAKEATDSEKKLWHLIPKHHYVAHMPDQACLVNPKFVWCYGSESMVGRIARLGQSCLSGTQACFVSKSLMQKYVIAMHLAFLGME